MCQLIKPLCEIKDIGFGLIFLIGGCKIQSCYCQLWILFKTNPYILSNEKGKNSQTLICLQC